MYYNTDNITKTPLWDKRKQDCFRQIGDGYNASSFDEMMEEILEKAKKYDYTVEIQVCEENSGFCF